MRTVWLVEALHREFCGVMMSPQVFETWTGAWGYAKECVKILHHRVGMNSYVEEEGALEALLDNQTVTFPTYSGGDHEATVRMWSTILRA